MEADDEGILAKILVKEGIDGVQVCLKTLYVYILYVHTLYTYDLHILRSTEELSGFKSHS